MGKNVHVKGELKSPVLTKL